MKSKIINWFKSQFNQYQDLNKLRNLGIVFAISNIITSSLFLTWWASDNPGTAFTTFIWLLIIAHLLLGSVFLHFSSSYKGSKWVLWSWISLIFISPLGIGLLYYCSLKMYWELDTENIQKTNSANSQGLFFKNNTNKLEKQFNSSLTHLSSINKEIFDAFLKQVMHIHNTPFQQLNMKQITTIIAMFLTIKQSKQKDFNNLVWMPHWYDNRHFDFAVKSDKIINSKNKYPIAIAVIVLDECNNYQKIFDAREEIKENLKFSPAKIISLHYGMEYKIFVNE